MNIDEFQKKRLEAYFNAHATDEQKSRRQSHGLTIGGAYKWIESKLRRAGTDGEIAPSASGVIVGDDEWCYAELMRYFTDCEEGDTYKTEAEINAEEERQKAEQVKRDEKAAALRKEHAERVAKWALLTPSEIREDIERVKWLRAHPYHAHLSAEELEQKRKEAFEAERKRQIEAEAHEAKEAERKAKAEAKAERARLKAEAEERKARLANAQMSFNF